MKITEQTKKLIYNLPLPKLETDFRLNIISVLLIILFFGGAVFYQLSYLGTVPLVNLLYLGIGFIVLMAIVSHLPLWSTLLGFLALGWLLAYAFLGENYFFIIGLTSVAFLIAPAFQIAQNWEKAIVLRFGRFRRSPGPGLFLLFPLIERVAEYVDTRIRATDFSAETTLTKDTVPVHVDAIAFWMIWDPRKAILELENFLDAVVLSAQTALRDAIGKNELSVLLSERDRLGKEIQGILEAKTSGWGITILSIEIRDIIIPKELEDAMSKRAQAERERQSRLILGTAEVEVAQKFEEASERYKANPVALQLRAMNILYEGLKKGGSLVLVPASVLESMSLGTSLGLTAFDKAKRLEDKNQGGENHDKT